MFKQIANYLYNKQIKKKQVVVDNIRQKELKPFKNVKSFLLLFDASTEENYQLIHSIVNDLKDANKIVRTIGYVPWKHAPHYCLTKLSWDFITSKNIHFTGIPKVQFVEEVILENFDVLIDFTTEEIKPLQYIASLSMAKLKVTSVQSNNKIFDFVIADKTFTYKKFFNEFKLYLDMFTNEKNECL